MRTSPLLKPLSNIIYLITFTTYGTHLPGHLDGSYSRRGVIEPSQSLVEFSESTMQFPAFTLNAPEREIVLRSIQEVCLTRRWGLKAAHVRTTHAHVVVDSPAAPSEILRDFKSYASGSLNTHFGRAKRWSRSGNSARLTTDQSVRQAIHYVTGRQGTPMSVYVSR